MDKLDLLNSAETAEALEIDRGTLTRWVRAGKIDWVYQGAGVRLFDPAEVKRVKALREREREIKQLPKRELQARVMAAAS